MNTGLLVNYSAHTVNLLILLRICSRETESFVSHHRMGQNFHIRVMDQAFTVLAAMRKQLFFAQRVIHISVI
ncbi:MAG: hypothetical protein COA78_04870 [Blastopirellula sp.]|nr:MAG: hypothetical protein COA78_04870 [Blastopirellula sp.]